MGDAGKVQGAKLVELFDELVAKRIIIPIPMSFFMEASFSLSSVG